jgi:glycosyltransferase involved in cell wall biosynthesis
LTTLPHGEFRFFPKIFFREDVKIFAFPDFIPDSLKRTGFGFVSLFQKLLFVAFEKYDIVHADNGHRPSGGWPCKFHRFLYGTKYVTEWWDLFGRGGQYDSLSFLKKITKGKYDLLCEVSDKKKADGVIALSSAMATHAKECGVAAEKLTVIQGGSDVRGISFNCDTDKRKMFGLKNSSLCFAFVGMNEGEFLDAQPFAMAISELSETDDVQWFTTGRSLSVQIKLKNGIGEELKEFGWVDYEQYSDLLSCADVFVLTQASNKCNETRWPNKFGDYLAAGRVIVATPVGEISDFCERYPDSIRSCGFKPGEISISLRRLLKEKSTLLEIGAKNREIAEREMSWAKMAERLEKFYYHVKHPTKNSNPSAVG